MLVDAGDALKRIEIAFRVADESAVPLALEKQVVLGGGRLNSMNSDGIRMYLSR